MHTMTAKISLLLSTILFSVIMLRYTEAISTSCSTSAVRTASEIKPAHLTPDFAQTGTGDEHEIEDLFRRLHPSPEKLKP